MQPFLGAAQGRPCGLQQFCGHDQRGMQTCMLQRSIMP